MASGGDATIILTVSKEETKIINGDMRTSSRMGELYMPIIDEIDMKILQLLKNNARISLTEIAKKVGLSVMGVKNRINRLEKRGIITNYSASIDYTKLGYDIIAFVGISAEAKKRMEVLKELKKHKEIITCPEHLKLIKQ